MTANRDTPPPVLDRAAFDGHRAIFGDARILRFLGLLEDELTRRAAAVEEAAARGDREELASHVHAIASTAGNLGFTALLVLGRRLEEDAPGLTENRLAATLDELRRNVEAALEMVERLRAEIGAGTA